MDGPDNFNVDISVSTRTVASWLVDSLERLT